MTQLCTMLLGPQSGGRGYRILECSGLPALADSALSRLNAMPLALAGWADVGEEAFVARVPLGDNLTPALLLRAKLIGQAASGSIAFAHGVILTAEAVARLPAGLEELLVAIPEPDGSPDFARKPLDFASDQQIATVDARNWAGLGLAWRDRWLQISRAADAETVALSALASIVPPEQRTRVRGWATTAALPPSGAFAPARVLQLIVSPANGGSPGPHYLPATVTADGFDGMRVDPPETWTMWQRLKTLVDPDLALRRAFGELAWVPQSAELAPGAFVHLAVAAVIDTLHDSPDALTRLLNIVASEPDLAGPGGAALCEAVGKAPLGKAVMLAESWNSLSPAAKAALGPVDQQLAAHPDIHNLPANLIERAVQVGIADAFSRGSEGAARLLQAVDTRWLAAVLTELTESGDWTKRHAEFVSALLLRLAKSETAGQDAEILAHFAVGLGRCLDWSDTPAVAANLLAPQVASTMARRAPNLLAAYSSTLLHLSDAIAAGNPLQFRMMRAMLALLDGGPGGVAHAAV